MTKNSTSLSQEKGSLKYISTTSNQVPIIILNQNPKGEKNQESQNLNQNQIPLASLSGIHEQSLQSHRD